MYNYYELTTRTSELYKILEDDISRDIFWARLKFDIAPSIANILRAANVMRAISDEEYQRRCLWKNRFKAIMAKGDNILLYGSRGLGEYFAASIFGDGGDFSGFCDDNFEHYPNGMLGKKVYSPQWLLEHAKTSYVVITALTHEKRIFNFLLSHHFPQEHILTDFGGASGMAFPEQYFEFSNAFFPKGTAFIDAGCFDGHDSLRFAEWCCGDYSEIIALDPDPANFKNCRHALKSLRNVRLMPAALGSTRSKATFFTWGSAGSRLASAMENSIYTKPGYAEEIAVDVLPLDEIIGEDKVGFIKMDIEGAELDALHGAKVLLQRDKPFLAVSVYHISGDMLAIMDYLHNLVPEYHFWLRHYTPSNCDTVLYASINPETRQ